MTDPYFFGYGSLVNRATHDYPQAQPARLRGWRRSWRHTSLRKLAYLTAEPAPGYEIDGLIAAVPGGDWQALDLRERAYDRHHVGPEDLSHGASPAISVQVYAVAPEHSARPDERHPLLLSYIDTVVQGFLREFGEEGVTEFFASTSGWDAPILNDRAAPIYPRAQKLSRSETALVDEGLTAVLQQP